MFKFKAQKELCSFLRLYGAMFAAFGAASPFLPSFLAERGLTSTHIALVLALGTATRILAAPIVGRLADEWQRPRAILTAGLVISSIVALAYIPAYGLFGLALVSMAHAAALAPLTGIADALALSQRRFFEYGWVRAAGSAAFVAGTLGSGAAVDRYGLPVIFVLNAGFLALAGLSAKRVPETISDPSPKTRPASASALLSNPVFRRMVLVSALILGSHAMHDAFAVIRWRAAGFSSGLVSVLLSEAVVAEVVVLMVIGPALLRRTSAAACAAIAATAGICRWTVVSQTLSPAIIACVEPLHGLTFALLHLACMRIIADTVPETLAVSAQAFYGVVGAGSAGVIVTLASGPLYQRYGGSAFLVMTAICALALVLSGGLRYEEPHGASS